MPEPPETSPKTSEEAADDHDAHSPRTRDGARTRQHMLDVARRLFLENGFHQTTTRAIARAADVSDALLYRYFPSKRDLFDAVLDDGLSHLEPYVRFGAPALAGLRMRETLEAAAYTTLEIIRRDREVFQLIIAESRLLEGDQRVPTLMRELHRSLADRLDAFIALGEARPCDTLVFSRQLVGGIAVHAMYTFLFGEDLEVIDTERYLREVLDAAMRALEP